MQHMLRCEKAVFLPAALLLAMRRIMREHTTEENKRECVSRYTFPSDRAPTKPSASPNLWLPFILDCTSRPDLLHSETLPHRREERGGCARTWRRIYITPLQIVNAAGFENKICTAVPGSSRCRSRASGWKERGDKGRWRGRKEIADDGDGGGSREADYVGEHIGACGCCAKEVRVELGSRDLRGRADE